MVAPERQQPIGGDLTTANSNISVNNDVVITIANTSVSAGTATVTFGSTLTFDSHDLTIAGNEITFRERFRVLAATLPWSRGQRAADAARRRGTAGNRVDLTPTKLAYLQPGFASITFGRADSTAAVTVNAVNFVDPTTVVAGSALMTVAGLCINRQSCNWSRTAAELQLTQA